MVGGRRYRGGRGAATAGLLAVALGLACGKGEGGGGGAGAALGAVEDYLRHSKAAEPKTQVGAIARSALVAFEREHASQDLLEPGMAAAVSRRLCGAAVAVPAEVPKGKKYQPDTAEGRDFHTGDAERGWRCLRFDVAEPIYCQYSYAADTGFKASARGYGRPLGPGAFEAAAECDFDGDGKTSFYARIGRVDPEAGAVQLDPELFVVDDGE
ncbi:MAG: type II secretion system protein [Polyangiaceae bacterium]|nr:type II secretion system protein [Polyangiaceae bacterium]